MTNKPKLAILLEFGFHEIKKYIHSGFADELSKEFDIVWFAIDKSNEEFHDYFSSTGMPIVYFDEKSFQKAPSSIEKWNQIIRRNWIARKGLGGFHNHSKVRSKSLKTSILGNSLAKSILEKLALNRIKKNYTSFEIEQQFSKYEIDAQLLTGYSSCFAKSFATSGFQKKIPVHYLANSWKDIFIDNFLPFKSFSTIFVWSKRMIQDYKYHMPYLEKANFVVSGNPTFDILLDAKPNKNRQFYAEKYDLDVKSKWLLYTMMPVGLVKDEIETIKFTAKEIEKKHTKEEVSILIRKNPTHKKEDFKDLHLPNNLKITDHYCSFDKKKDMVIQSSEGEKEWLDLLLHSTLNLSVPSTVTLEFLALNKKVINIEYDLNDTLDPRLNQFFEAGFYKPLFEGTLVTRAKSVNSVIKEIDGEHLANNPDIRPEHQKNKSSTIIIDYLKKHKE